jgi:DNA-binding CsgD family transcriptional regulator
MRGNDRPADAIMRRAPRVPLLGEPLTERQREVALGVERGLTNEEIAAKLDISPRTVKAHCEAVKHKLGVARRRLIPPALREREGRM